MKVEIDFLDETDSVTKKEETLVRELIEIGLKIEKVQEECEISVTFVSNDRIQEINRDYRGLDRPTDVISFALEELGEDETEFVPQDGMPRVLGDIIVSLEKTKEQATEYEHSFERELGFLVVHGLLHLLGYDHKTPEEERAMFTKQEEILAAYGLKR